jgi:hypothetical protein
MNKRQKKILIKILMHLVSRNILIQEQHYNELSICDSLLGLINVISELFSFFHMNTK